MANFNTVDQGAPLGSSVTPRNPVVDQSMASVLGVAGTLAQGAATAYQEGVVRSERMAIREAELQAKVNTGTAVSRLTGQLSTIANAVEAGEMKPSEAGVRKRAILSSMQAENPIDAENLMQAFNAFGQDAGAISKTGTEDFQIQKDRYKEATMAGYVKPWMSSDQKTEATENYFNKKLLTEQLQEQQKRLALLNEQASLQGKGLSNAKSQIELDQARLQLQQRSTIKQVADASMPEFRNNMRSYIEQAKQPGADKTAIQQAMAAEFQTLQAAVSSLGADAGGEYASNLFAPFKAIYDSSVAFASGKITEQAYQTEVDTRIGLQSLNLTGDPADARTLAILKMVPGASTNLSISIDQLAKGKSTLAKNSEGQDGSRVLPANPYDTAEADSYSNYLKYIGDRAKESVSGTMVGGEDAQKDLDHHMSMVIKGGATYANTVENPQDMKLLADFVASDSFGAYVAKKGGVPGDAKTKEAVTYLFQQEYIGQAEKAIKNEFTRATVSRVGEGKGARGGATAPAPEKIELVYSGGTAMFKAKAGSEKDVMVQTVTKDLNKNVAPLVNRLTRISAHLQGDRNYKAAFDTIYNNMLESEAKEQ